MPAFKLFIAGITGRTVRRQRGHAAPVKLVPFAVTIPPAERDRGLPQKLRAEWGGILAWAIEGCRHRQRVGLSPPAAVVAATDEDFGDEDVVQAWIDECCQIDRNKATYSAALYGSFWHGRSGVV